MVQVESNNERDEQVLTDSREIALHVVQAALEKNGLEPALLDVSETSSYTDFIAIVSGRSMRQVEAISEHIQNAMKTAGHDALGLEGERGGHWMLLDYGSVVVHVFHHPVREYYDLEGLWADAPRIELDVPAAQRYAENYA